MSGSERRRYKMVLQGRHYFEYTGKDKFGYCSCGEKIIWNNRPESKFEAMDLHARTSRKELIERIESILHHCECVDGPVLKKGHELWIVDKCVNCKLYLTQAQMQEVRDNKDERTILKSELKKREKDLERQLQREKFLDCPQSEEAHEVIWTENLEGPPYVTKYKTSRPSHEKAAVFLQKLSSYEPFCGGKIICPDGVEFDSGIVNKFLSES